MKLTQIGLAFLSHILILARIFSPIPLTSSIPAPRSVWRKIIMKLNVTCVFRPALLRGHGRALFVVLAEHYTERIRGMVNIIPKASENPSYSYAKDFREVYQLSKLFEHLDSAEITLKMS